MIEVPTKWPTKPPVTKTVVINDNTANIGAADRSDYYISSYQFLRTTLSGTERSSSGSCK